MKKDIIDVLSVVLFAFLINNFVFTHAKVPTSSMVPTIGVGDRLIINAAKSHYDIPERGDIVAFKLEGERLIKRCIATEGDTIHFEDGHVFVNGKRVDESEYLTSDIVTLEGHGIEYPYIVPENHIFVMGDNRVDSYDSRYFGAISVDSVWGIGAFRIYPFDKIGELE